MTREKQPANGMLTGKNLTKSFSSRIIFRNINFSLSSHGLLHVVGRNGAGKTTLLKIVVGLLTPDQGVCTRQDCEYLAADSDGFFSRLTAWDNLRWWVGLKNPRPDNEKILQTLQKVGIRFPRVLAVKYFSTGMKRRLGLARLMLSPSPLWVLDEPLASLDKDGTELFAAALTSHLQTGGSALIVSHEAAVFAHLITSSLEMGTNHG